MTPFRCRWYAGIGRCPRPHQSRPPDGRTRPAFRGSLETLGRTSDMVKFLNLQSKIDFFINITNVNILVYNFGIM